MLREPLTAVKTRFELGAIRMGAQAGMALAAAFALLFAIPGAVLWYLETDSTRVALFAVAGTFLALALIAWIAIVIIEARQRRVRRESNLGGLLVAALAARPGVAVQGGSRLLRAVARAPLLSLGGALVAGLLLTAVGSRGADHDNNEG